MALNCASHIGQTSCRCCVVAFVVVVLLLLHWCYFVEIVAAALMLFLLLLLLLLLLYFYCITLESGVSNRRHVTAIYSAKICTPLHLLDFIFF